jgi:hypothetical protein
MAEMTSVHYRMYVQDAVGASQSDPPYQSCQAGGQPREGGSHLPLGESRRVVLTAFPSFFFAKEDARKRSWNKITGTLPVHAIVLHASRDRPSPAQGAASLSG